MSDEFGLTRAGDTCARGYFCYEGYCWPLCNRGEPCPEGWGSCSYGPTRNTLNPGVGVCVLDSRKKVAETDECPWTRDGEIPEAPSADAGTPRDAGNDGGSKHRYIFVAANDPWTCAIRDDNALFCGANALPATFMRERLRWLDIGDNAVCGIRTTGIPVCAALRGSDTYGHLNVQSGTFQTVSVEDDFACGLDTMGFARCWGSGRPQQGLSGKYVAVATNEDGMCAIAAETGAIRCATTTTAQIPSGKFVSLAGHGQLWCALDAGGRVKCWGMSANILQRLTEPESGVLSFKNIWIRSGLVQLCGITPQDTIDCVGGLVGPPPQGMFSSLTLDSSNYGCGLTLAGTVECWRFNRTSTWIDTNDPPPP